eukprot:1375044-Amorphochlora_amoeboformis.AAC.3
MERNAKSATEAPRAQIVVVCTLMLGLPTSGVVRMVYRNSPGIGLESRDLKSHRAYYSGIAIDVTREHFRITALDVCGTRALTFCFNMTPASSQIRPPYRCWVLRWHDTCLRRQISTKWKGNTSWSYPLMDSNDFLLAGGFQVHNDLPGFHQKDDRPSEGQKVFPLQGIMVSLAEGVVRVHMFPSLEVDVIYYT